MSYAKNICLSVLLAAIIVSLIAKLFNKDARAQRKLNRYLRKHLSSEEIGRSYERYIGHLYELKGYDVLYYGAIKGYADLGRDLIVKSSEEILIIQAKCWAKYKQIPEKHIFQLFGTMTHFKLTTDWTSRPIKAVFYTSANYSDVAIDAAKVLGVELRNRTLSLSYPMIKCSVFANGERFYYLPFHSKYDLIKLDLQGEDCFVTTVKEATQRGFKRAS